MNKIIENIKEQLTEHPILCIFFFLNCGFVILFLVLALIGILEGKYFVELSDKDNSVQMVLYILPIMLSFFSLGIWIFSLLKKGWSVIAMIVGSICFLALFIILMILTFYATEKWIPDEWTPEIVEKRIQLETEVCFLIFFFQIQLKLFFL